MGKEGHSLDLNCLDLRVYYSTDCIVLFTIVGGNMEGKKRGREGLRKMKEGEECRKGKEGRKKSDFKCICILFSVGPVSPKLHFPTSFAL